MSAKNHVLTAEKIIYGSVKIGDGPEVPPKKPFDVWVRDAAQKTVAGSRQFALAPGDSITVNAKGVAIRELRIYADDNEKKGQLLTTLTPSQPGQSIMDGDGWAECHADKVYLKHQGDAEDSYWFGIAFQTDPEVVWDPDVHEVKPT